jgi:thioredoxin-dependent peroxiredoxin
MSAKNFAPIIAIFLAMSFLAQAEPLAVGQNAPAVTATTETGASLSFADVYKTGYTLVYFFPKADTPGCTAQGCSLRDAYADLTKLGVTVIGVSTDSVEAQKAFKGKYKFPFTLIADTDKKVLRAFGQDSLMFASRQAFLIDKGGKVVWRDLKASTAQQAADVIAALKRLEAK